MKTPFRRYISAQSNAGIAIALNRRELPRVQLFTGGQRGYPIVISADEAIAIRQALASRTNTDIPIAGEGCTLRTARLHGLTRLELHWPCRWIEPQQLLLNKAQSAFAQSALEDLIETVIGKGAAA